MAGPSAERRASQRCGEAIGAGKNLPMSGQLHSMKTWRRNREGHEAEGVWVTMLTWDKEATSGMQFEDPPEDGVSAPQVGCENQTVRAEILIYVM